MTLSVLHSIEAEGTLIGNVLDPSNYRGKNGLVTSGMIMTSMLV